MLSTDGACYQRGCNFIKNKKAYSYIGEYCCEGMVSALGECRIHLDYDPENNIYFVPFIYPSRESKPLRYCPWCAKNIAP